MLASLLFVGTLIMGAFSSPIAHAPDNHLVPRAGPSGYVISPAGGTTYNVGDTIHFQYQRVFTSTTWTSAVGVYLISEYIDGTNTTASLLLTRCLDGGNPNDQSPIDAYLVIPPDREGYYGKPADAVSFQLQVIESQKGPMNVQSFVAAAPTIKIEGIFGPSSP